MKIVKKIVFVFCFFIFWSPSSRAHPFYVSICQIDYNKENRSLEISLKIFADDLLAGLESTGATKLYLGEEKENPNTDILIEKYVHSKLKLTVNGNLVEYTFIGKEMETDVVWSYWEIEDVSELAVIEVACNILTEVYDTQSNIIQINNGNGIKSMLLNKRNTVDSIKF